MDGYLVARWRDEQMSAWMGRWREEDRRMGERVDRGSTGVTGWGLGNLAFALIPTLMRIIGACRNHLIFLDFSFLICLKGQWSLLLPPRPTTTTQG